MRNKGLERSIKDLMVWCENKTVGCKWTGQLSKLDDHVENVCPFTELYCMHGCDAVMIRRDIAEHEEACELRPFQCQHCKSYTSTYRNVVNEHSSTCIKYPVPCPNKCSMFIAREHLPHHLDNECELCIVECEFRYAGCTVRCPKKDLSSHLKSDLCAHLSMVSSMNKRLLQENSELSKRLTYLESMAVVGVRIEQQGEELAEQLKTVQKESKALVAHLRGTKALIGLPPIEISVDYYTIIRMMDERYDRTDGLEVCNFYSHIGGYRMQLQLQNQLFKACVLLRIYMVQGECDDDLEWPFNGIVVVIIKPRQQLYRVDFRRAPLKCKSRVVGGSVGTVSCNGWGPSKPIFKNDLIAAEDCSIVIDEVIIP